MARVADNQRERRVWTLRPNPQRGFRTMESVDPSQEFPIGPLALLFPDMPETAFQALKQDILLHGQRTPIAVHQGLIVDGRHRKRACDELGLTPRYVFLDEYSDALGYALSMNVFLRHLSPSQLAVIAFRLYLLSRNLSPPRNEEEGEGEVAETMGPESAILQIPRLTLAQAADRVGVSTRTVSDVAKVYSEGAPDLRIALDQGLVTASDGAKIVRETEETQNRAVELLLGGRARTASGAADRAHREMAQHRSEAAPQLESWRSENNGAVLHNAGISALANLVDRKSIDAIITAVPGQHDTAHTLKRLAAFASHALREGGAMAALCMVRRLPQAFRNLETRSVRFTWEFDYRFDLPATSPVDLPGLDTTRMPLLVFGKPDFVLPDGNDVIQLPPPDRNPSGRNPSGIDISDRHRAGIDLVVRRLCLPGWVICDPLLELGDSTALAAVRYGCGFVGSSHDPQRLEQVRNSLAREEEDGNDRGGGHAAGTEDQGNLEPGWYQLTLDGRAQRYS